MIIEYLLFLWGIFSWIKSLLYSALGKSEQAHREKQLKRQMRTPVQNTLAGGSVLILASIPYTGAYFYADIQLLWLVLGSIYLLMGILILAMGALAYIASKHYSDEIEEYEKMAHASSSKLNSWPRWQEKALCIFQYIVLVLWLYSWRHLIA